MGYYVSHVLERRDSNEGMNDHEEINVQENQNKPIPNSTIKPLFSAQDNEIAINLSRPQTMQ